MMRQLALDRGRPANSGGIDQLYFAAVRGQTHVDGIAGGAGNIVDDCAIETRESVEQRRFADVRASDQCELQVRVRGGSAVALREPRDDLIEKLADTASMSGGDEK